MDTLLNRERATEIMARESIDGLLARLPVNCLYLSNYRGLGATAASADAAYWAVLPRDAQAPAALVLPSDEVARAASWIDNVCGYAEPATAFTALARALQDAGLATARLVADDPRSAGWLAEQGVTDIEVSYQPQVFNEIRLIKTPAETELLKHAAYINEMAFLLTADSAEAGSTAAELENLYMMTLAQQGGRGTHLICGTGAAPVASIRENEPVGMTALGSYRGYHAAFGRCVVTGEPDRDYRKQHAHLLAGWEKARELLQPGKRYAEVSQAVGDAVRAAGLSGFVNPAVHSTGLEFADDPAPAGGPPRALTDQVMAPDMIVTVAMSHADAAGATLHIEDTVRITTYGHERLSKTDFSIRVSGTTD